jgi:hypothetical protein
MDTIADNKIEAERPAGHEVGQPGHLKTFWPGIFGATKWP